MILRDSSGCEGHISLNNRTREDLAKRRLDTGRSLYEFHHGKSENAITKRLSYKSRVKLQERNKKGRLSDL